MKKLICTLLVLALVLSAAVFAETTVERHDYSVNSMTLNKYNDVLIVQDGRNDPYYLMNANGERLTYLPYTNIKNSGALFIASMGTGINDDGVIDANGNTLVPSLYTDVEIISSKWQIASHTIEADENNYDYYSTNYSTGVKSFYIVDFRDVFFCGERIATIGRTDYRSATSRGNYLILRNVNGEYSAYDSKWNQSPYAVTGTSEYESKSLGGGQYEYIHVGSGQKAFCPECTLTPEEVSSPVLVDNKKNVLDLKGNVLFSAASVATSLTRTADGYFITTLNSAKGILDSEGNVIIPTVNKSFEYGHGAFHAGYAIAFDADGKLVFYDKNGNLTVQTRYNESIARVYSTFARVQDIDGSYIIITGAGELEEHFKDVSYSYEDTCGMFVVEKLDGTSGVIGMLGEDIIPSSRDYRGTYNISVTYDGSVILAYNNATKTYELYNVDYTPEIAEPEVKLNDGEWLCPECGYKNSGNFCPNDGTKKPEANVWFCPECGNKNEGNFCPNDGTKKP